MMDGYALLGKLLSGVQRRIGQSGWGILALSFWRSHLFLLWEHVLDLHSCRYCWLLFDCLLSFLIGVPRHRHHNLLPFKKKFRWFLPHEINLRIRNLMFSTLQPFVGRELFAAGFVSCWSQLNEASQRQLVRSLEMAFSSPNIPPEILATLLNLVSFCCFLR